MNLLKSIKVPLFLIGIFLLAFLICPIISMTTGHVSFLGLSPLTIKSLGIYAEFFSGVSSLAMVLFAYWSLMQNKEQVLELKKQWTESRQPIISVTFTTNASIPTIKIRNHGISNVINCLVQLQDEEHNLSEINAELYKSPRLIPPKDALCIPLGSQLDISNPFKVIVKGDNFPETTFSVSYTHCDKLYYQSEIG